MRVLISTLILAGCGMQYYSNGVRPQPKGDPAVLLAARDGYWVPIACYDPQWERMRGPADCADLIPPGATVRRLSDDRIETLGDRQPAPCPAGTATGFPAPATAELAVWPPTATTDLDADGTTETITRADGGFVVHHAGRRIGGCAP